MLDENTHTIRESAPFQSDLSPRDSTGQFLLVIALAAFTLGLGAVTARTLTSLHLPGKFEISNSGLLDYYNAIYYPVRTFLDGGNPYSVAFEKSHPDGIGFPLFSPITLLLHSPFAILEPSSGRFLYYLFNVSLCLIIARFTLRVCRLPSGWPQIFGLAAALIVFRPGYATLYLGQLAFTMTLATYLSLHLARDKPLLSGLALAVTSCKPNFTIPLGILMLCRRDFRALIWGTVFSTGGALLAIGYMASHGDGWIAFFEGIMEKYGSVKSHPETGDVTTSYV
ncbi:MAG: glycosyltransferase family 87 protein, partial [Verrucomicrobiota bacterium]